MTTAWVDDVPALLLTPDQGDGELVLWLSHLAGSAEKELPTLHKIVAAGHPVVSFDPPMHGRRAGADDPRAFATAALSQFRLRMWPILGRATLDAMRVLDWAQSHLGQSGRGVRAGGVSMGGDIAIAVAGIDDRVNTVATIGSTPDWYRPDMHQIDNPDVLIDQGTADRYAQWFADQLNPAQHPQRYARGVDIAFEGGGADRHIPLTDAEDFRMALGGSGAERIQITSHSGLDHFGVTTSESAIAAAVHRLTR